MLLHMIVAAKHQRQHASTDTAAQQLLASCHLCIDMASAQGCASTRALKLTPCSCTCLHKHDHIFSAPGACHGIEARLLLCIAVIGSCPSPDHQVIIPSGWRMVVKADLAPGVVEYDMVSVVKATTSCIKLCWLFSRFYIPCPTVAKGHQLRRAADVSSPNRELLVKQQATPSPAANCRCM